MKTELLSQNSKIKKTSKLNGVKIFNFSISAYNNKETGKITCPFAGLHENGCKKFCYAKKGFYRMYAEKAMDRRHKATLCADFVEKMDTEIKRRKLDFVRIHDSGDFYSPNYIQKWFAIMRLNPKVKFYAYTKSFTLFSGLNLPRNFDIIASFGGKHDHLIDTKKMRHAQIFKSLEELEKAGYIDASNNDLLATKWYNRSKKIGILFH